MINKNDIRKITDSILRGRRRRLDHVIMHPVREWYCALGVFVAIITVGATWSAQTYIAYRNDLGEAEPAEAEAVVYRASVVSSALEIIERERIEYQIITERLSQQRGSGGEVAISGGEAIVEEREGEANQGDVAPEPVVPPILPEPEDDTSEDTIVPAQ